MKMPFVVFFLSRALWLKRRRVLMGYGVAR